jgi:alkyl sulfatase BDS1-like metallo-beta-lactamase superfamily hydrolase
MAFDYIGIIMDKKAMENENYTIEFEFTDSKEIYTVYMRYGALLYAKGKGRADSDITVKCPKKMLLLLAAQQADAFRKKAEVT